MLGQKPAAMDIAAIEREKDAIIEQYGEWTSHSIELAPNLYTVPNKEQPAGRPAHYIRVVQDFLLRDPKGMRVLDLGCLEGMYAIEFARSGAQALGVEGRLANVEKARFAKRVLGLSNCDFVNEDVRDLSRETHGTFDVILCCGILYHLDAPEVFGLLERMSEMCTGIVIIDTHVATADPIGRFPGRLEEPTSYAYKGQDYAGRYFREFTTETPDEKLKNLLASLDNNRSFWLERSALYRALNATGFSRIYEDPLPHLDMGTDRLTFVALAS